MDIKNLYITAVVIAAISGGYYYYSGKGNKLETASARSMTYSAEKINLTQTDDAGNLYIRAQVDRLEQDMQKQTLTSKSASSNRLKSEIQPSFWSVLHNG